MVCYVDLAVLCAESDCGIQFEPKRPGHVYCSAECRGRAHRVRQKSLRELVARCLGTKEEARLLERRQAAKLPPLRRSKALDATAAAEALRRMGSAEPRFQILAQGAQADELPRSAVREASHFGLAIAVTGSGEPLLVIVVGSKVSAQARGKSSGASCAE